MVRVVEIVDVVGRVGAVYNGLRVDGTFAAVPLTLFIELDVVGAFAVELEVSLDVVEVEVLVTGARLVATVVVGLGLSAVDTLVVDNLETGAILELVAGTVLESEDFGLTGASLVKDFLEVRELIVELDTLFFNVSFC